jgi:hypothetical protein
LGDDKVLIHRDENSNVVGIGGPRGEKSPRIGGVGGDPAQTFGAYGRVGAVA